MSCFFCESFKHLSQFCDIHVTNDSRKTIAIEKNCCEDCLSFISLNQKCCYKNRNKKCYICFSRSHHTVFCPDRDTALHSLIPNIDINLYQRFIQIFEPIEQFFFAILLPTNLNVSKFKVLKIFENPSGNFEIHGSCINVVTDTDTKSLKNIFAFNGLVIFKMAVVDLKDLELSPKDFFRLLSPSTKILKCSSTKLTSKISLKEILQRIPNAKTINLFETANIEFENTWPMDMLLCKELETITFCINNYDFNAEELQKIMKKKSNIKIFLKIVSSINDKNCNILKEKLSKHFNFFDYNIYLRNPPYLKITVIESSKTWSSNSFRNFGRFTPI